MTHIDARLDRIEAYMRGNRMDASFDRLDGILDRINTHLQIILDHLDGIRLLKGPPMSEQRHDHIKALTQQIAARGRLAAAEPEQSLPDVPLHQRGFGIMGEDTA